MRTLTPYPTVKVHCYNLVFVMVGHIDILNADIYIRFQSGKGLGNFTKCIVRYFLTDYFQRFRCHAKY